MPAVTLCFIALSQTCASGGTDTKLGQIAANSQDGRGKTSSQVTIAEFLSCFLHPYVVYWVGGECAHADHLHLRLRSRSAHAHTMTIIVQMSLLYLEKRQIERKVSRDKWVHINVCACLFCFFFVNLFLLMCELLLGRPPPPRCFNPATVFLATAGRRAATEKGEGGLGIRKRLFDSVFFYQKAKNIRKRTYLCLADVAGGGR